MQIDDFYPKKFGITKEGLEKFIEAHKKEGGYLLPDGTIHSNPNKLLHVLKPEEVKQWFNREQIDFTEFEFNSKPKKPIQDQNNRKGPDERLKEVTYFFDEVVPIVEIKAAEAISRHEKKNPDYKIGQEERQNVFWQFLEYASGIYQND